MSDDLWSFFIDVPSNGYTIEGSHCISDECSTYEGNIDPNNIWEFDLTSRDGTKQKVETSIVDFLEPKIRFSLHSNGKKIDLDVTPNNCLITENGFLCINENNQDHKFEIVIKKV